VPTTAPLPLSRQRILTCAVHVADRDGLDATSLRKVAGELGVHVTSLYNHVATKEALLDGLVEELFAGADLPHGEFAWDVWVREFVAGVAGVARHHPGAFAVLLRRPVQGPRASATFEVGLAAFRRAGLSAAECYGAIKTVSLAVLGCCVEQAYAAAGGDGPATDVASLSWQDFPVLHEVLDHTDEVDVVTTLADVLVAGLATRIP
jgi:AcrR family transcriptional regulator